MRSFAIVIRRAYFEAKKRRKYAKNVVVNRSATALSIVRVFIYLLRDLASVNTMKQTIVMCDFSSCNPIKFPLITLSKHYTFAQTEGIILALRVVLGCFGHESFQLWVISA